AVGQQRPETTSVQERAGMTGAGRIGVADADRGGDVLTGYESLAGRFDQVRTALGVALYALSPLVLWLGFWWFGRGAAAGADDVGEHAPVALVHLDAHRDGPVPGEHVQQGPEG